MEVVCQRLGGGLHYCVRTTLDRAFHPRRHEHGPRRRWRLYTMTWWGRFLVYDLCAFIKRRRTPGKNDDERPAKTPPRARTRLYSRRSAHLSIISDKPNLSAADDRSRVLVVLIRDRVPRKPPPPRRGKPLLTISRTRIGHGGSGGKAGRAFVRATGQS